MKLSTRNASHELRAALHEHLAWWGLRQFTSDPAYFAWQQQQLSPEDLKQLAARAEQKRKGDRHDEMAFYDAAAHPKIFPVLYSQRYDYYEVIASQIAAHCDEATAILDFGCGLGILTSFCARLFPDKQFVGVDRSSASIAVAQEQADRLGLRNLRFDCVDGDAEPLSGCYDLVVATHALLQAEQDPGLPSRSWQTFERGHDSVRQSAFEQRTGLGRRLDTLMEVLSSDGHMILCEKTRQLGRRVPFQRALAARGLQLLEPPTSVRYHSVEELVDDGPLYWLQRGSQERVAWDESPEPDEGRPFSPEALATPTDPESPLYENHWPSAQAAWEQVVDREVLVDTTRQEPDGRQMHVERGKFPGYHYLYCANTFDQRQLVIVEQARAAMLDVYYQEIVRGLS
ncbi:MAG: methyltransferase domain-containing protein [Nitrospira sp.]|nr:methyltransferase domain-containing protein [Nitrospira sp.]